MSMSMSRSGSGCCNTTTCNAAKASDMRCGGNRRSDEISCISSGVTTVAPTIALSAGHGHVSDLKGVADWTAAFMPSPTGFMHPWSLAARQQKAAAEQERSPPTTAGYVPR
ncbi:hypothetical protein PR202_ga24455 [Eleusine coracana subsp. coracana]|uniref:Uncharacterized protein n=1 Tax=Eleusine coracana subsp. coracana TaxID=191504 RepID=A0AAV5D7T3_ELECO|nr:hypothetical protein PR202_ga24455 [Eleusine coracana subsp. coracana]